VHSLTAIFLLCPDASMAAPCIQSISRTNAFSALLAHAHCFNPDDPVQARRLVEDYFALAADVPVARLSYRPDFGELDQLVETVARAAAEFGAGGPTERP
jgi:hypothetical protein